MKGLPLAQAAALTLTGWHSAGLGFLAGVEREAEVGPSNSKGPQVLSFPEVEARFGCRPAHCLLSPAPHPHPCHCQDQGAWKAVSDAQDHGHEGCFSARSKDSPLKPELMAFWAQASWFSCPTCFRIDRFCAAQGKSVIGFGSQAGQPSTPGKLSSQVSLAVPVSAPRRCEPFPAIRAPRLKGLGWGQ